MSELFTAAAFITPEHTRLALFDSKLHRLVRPPMRINTDCWNAPSHLLQIASDLEDMRTKAGSNTRIEQVAIAVAGKINGRGRKIERASRLAKWKGTDIPATLSEAMGNIPVHLGNAAVARSRYEVIKNPDVANTPCLTLYWGEGIGGSYIDRYGVVTALDPGHMEVPGITRTPLCLCDDAGHLDALAGGTRIGNVLNTSRLGYLTPELATSFADYVARVYSVLLTQHKCNRIIIGGQRYLNPLNKRNKALLHAGLVKGFNKHLGRMPVITESKLDYAPVETALTLLSPSLVSA